MSFTREYLNIRICIIIYFLSLDPKPKPKTEKELLREKEKSDKNQEKIDGKHFEYLFSFFLDLFYSRDFSNEFFKF